MLDNSPTTGRRWRLLAAAATAFMLAAGLTACAESDDELRTPDGSIISTVTSRIARVDIVNAGRDYAQTCLAPTAAADPAADISRVIVTDPALLDAFCALGVGPKVRAVTAADGSIPAYLGPQLGAVPTLGHSPTAAQVRTADPQLVLATPGTAAAVGALHATGVLGSTEVVTIGGGDDWRAVFTEVAKALDRSAAATERLAEFDAEAARIGRVMDAPHSQVSLVRFTPDAELIEGTGGFAPALLTQIGVARPAAQRTPEPTVVTDANFTAADGDLIYVSAQGQRGLDRGVEVLESDRWQEMGAPSWSRVLWVDDAVWYQTSGLAAAWLVLNDVKSSLNSTSS